MPLWKRERGWATTALFVVLVSMTLPYVFQEPACMYEPCAVDKPHSSLRRSAPYAFATAAAAAAAAVDENSMRAAAEQARVRNGADGADTGAGESAKRANPPVDPTDAPSAVVATPQDQASNVAEDPQGAINEQPKEGDAKGEEEQQEGGGDEDEQRVLAEVLKEEMKEEELIDSSDLTVAFRSRRLNKVFTKRRTEMLNVIKGHIKAVNKSSEYSPLERRLRIEALNLTMRHVNSTFNGYIRINNEIQKMIDTDVSTYEATMAFYKQYADMQRKRIDELQVQAMREHSDLHRVIETLKQLEAFEQQREEGVTKLNAVDLVLSRVDDNAQTLRQFLDDHAFMKAQQVADSSLVTVVKIVSDPGHKRVRRLRSDEKPIQAMSFLIDADNNQYTLSRPSDATELLEDENLLNDLIFLLVACFLASSACQAMNLPGFIGYVVAGTVLGPSGLNIISSIVAISTIGEMGVFFVLFTLGMEFSLSKLRELFNIAVFGTTLSMGLQIIIIVFAGSLLSLPLSESLFVGVIISLSSTTVAVNNLAMQDHETSYGKGLLGILLMQDVFLGVVIALTPMFATLDTVKFGDVVWMLLKLLLSFVLLGALCVVILKFVVSRLIRQMQHFDLTSRLLAAVALCFFMLKVTEKMEVSMELGCFLAGLMFSIATGREESGGLPGGAVSSSGAAGHGNNALSRIIHLIDPVKDIFLAVFFASVGMHVYPTFFVSNGWLLLTLLICVIVLKYTTTLLVLVGLMRPSLDFDNAHVVSVGLAQVSEFAFVLAGRGRSLEILSQPIYFLLLSLTSLTLLCAPFLWRAVDRPRHQSPS